MRIPRPVMRVIARVKPAVPQRAWTLLNTVASVAGDAPLVADPAAVPTVAVFAHPDDEIGCAGTLALLAGRVAVRPVYATRGDATRGASTSAVETGRRRADETTRSCAALGLSAPEFLTYADGELPAHIDEIARDVVALVSRYRPRQLFVPWFLDGHADHRAVSRAVAAADLPAELEIWAFEWWTPLTPNRIVDISSTRGRKEDAIGCHVTAAQAFDISAMLGLSRWRSLSGLHGHDHGEAFLVLPHREYRALCKRLVGGANDW